MLPFRTVKPGAMPGPDGACRRRTSTLNIFVRGLLRHAFTRIYFSDEAANAADSGPGAGADATAARR